MQFFVCLLEVTHPNGEGGGAAPLVELSGAIQEVRITGAFAGLRSGFVFGAALSLYPIFLSLSLSLYRTLVRRFKNLGFFFLFSQCGNWLLI